MVIAFLIQLSIRDNFKNVTLFKIILSFNKWCWLGQIITSAVKKMVKSKDGRLATRKNGRMDTPKDMKR